MYIERHDCGYSFNLKKNYKRDREIREEEGGDMREILLKYTLFKRIPQWYLMLTTN